jgi:hypothetical protein
MANVRLRVPVSLRSGEGRPRYFIADREIELVDGFVSPVVHDGQHYVFTHVLATTWKTGSATSDEIYVFEEAAPRSPD